MKNIIMHKVENSEFPNVTLINRYPLGTGIGEYVADLLQVGCFECISLIFKKSDAGKVNFPGKVVCGLIPDINPKLEFLFNAYLQRFSYAKLRNRIVKISTKGDIVHFTDPSIFPFVNNEKAIVTIHDIMAYYPDETGGGFMNGRYRFVVSNLKKYREYSNIITISNKVRDELLGIGFNDNITVIPYPISSTFKFLDAKKKAREALGLPVDKILVLSISTDTPRKNLGLVKKTIDLLGDGFNLVRVGPPVGNSITFNNIDDREKMNLIYNACDVLLFPTQDEGFGRPVIEAMASGLPTVVSDIKIMREIAGNASYFVQFTPEQCKEGILYAIEEESNFRKNGIDRAKEFSFGIFKQRMISYYLNLMS